MNTQQPQTPDTPAMLKNISFVLGIALVALAVAISWWWFPDVTWAKVVALLLFVLAAPPFSFIVVLEIANFISHGELKRTGKMTR